MDARTIDGYIVYHVGKMGLAQGHLYGDLKEQTYDLADAIGWKVIEEA